MQGQPLQVTRAVICSVIGKPLQYTICISARRARCRIETSENDENGKSRYGGSPVTVFSDAGTLALPRYHRRRIGQQRQVKT